MKNLTCFKAYDIRGELGDELNADIAFAIGKAIGSFLKPKKIVVGGDMRLSTGEIKGALSDGLLEAGVDVIDIGMTGSEEVYFATQFLGVDGGVEVTASHNPINFNGMKLVRAGAKPISSDTGLLEIKKLVEKGHFDKASKRGKFSKASILEDYSAHLLTYIDLNLLTPLKLVINSGNGAAGHVIDKLEEKFNAANIPLEIIKIHNVPDGNFPNGIPNPLLPGNRQDTINAVIKHKADIGIAFDGDFDRCFLFDENGSFIEGYYIVGLLASIFLEKVPNSKIIYDPRLYWNTRNIVEKAGGKAIMSKTGHAFIKERMRAEDAIYGGEMSAHHYFRDFSYCDSGMIPWLMIIEQLSIQKIPLSKMVQERIQLFPSPGEINISLSNSGEAIKKVLMAYKDKALTIDKTDGISLEFKEWRFNLRSSNTEDVIRLNIESNGDYSLMEKMKEEILELLQSCIPSDQVGLIKGIA